ncbi:acetyltransferase [Yonghaparkia sp. Root332]|uniref:acetyltransferase n=1 Tax=Yonghaparkia sp. Root332 TaxID=1736516 RepID=UPI0006FECB8F|nr:acetyltransferase [Yonghaparkia sp. Root332]KQV25457.1 hypothetical protein ASC54_00125 [Yonghaparkia sp. Root332]
MTRVVLVGAGGFARETLNVISALQASGERLTVEGVVDDAAGSQGVQRMAWAGIPHLGSVEEFLRDPSGEAYVIAIGSPSHRARVAVALGASELRPLTLRHPSSTVGLHSDIGAGVVICAGVQVSADVRIGAHVHLNPNATIGHDAVLEDFVSVNPGAIVSGSTTIGSSTLLGAGAVVLQGLSVGAGSVVGAAACVTRDVPSGVTAIGVPARWSARSD